MCVGSRHRLLFLAGQLFRSAFPIYLSAPISLLIAAHIQVQLMRCECPAGLSLAAEAGADVITGPAVLAPSPADQGAGRGRLQPQKFGATHGRTLIPGAKPARRQKLGPAGWLIAGQFLVLRCCNVFDPPNHAGFMAVMSPDLAGDTHGWDHPIAAMLCGSGCTPAFGDSWAPVLAPACVHPILLPPAPFSWDRSVPSPGCVPALL